MPGPFFNWRLLAEIPPQLAWYMIVNARRTGRIKPEFVEEMPKLFLADEPPRVFPAKLIGNLQMQSHLMLYRFSDDPSDRDMYARLAAGEEAALSVARDFCRLTWIDAVYTVPIDHADVRYVTTIDRPPGPPQPADDPRPRVVYTEASDELVGALTGRPVRAGEIVLLNGEPWIVVQFVVRTRGGIQQTDMFAYLDAPFDPEHMSLDSVALIPARYVTLD